MQSVLKKKRKGCGGKYLQKRKVLSLAWKSEGVAVAWATTDLIAIAGTSNKIVGLWVSTQYLGMYAYMVVAFYEYMGYIQITQSNDTSCTDYHSLAKLIRRLTMQACIA